VLDPSTVTVPLRGAVDGSVDAGVDGAVDAPDDAEGLAVAPLLHAPIAMTDANASAARRFEPELVTGRTSTLVRARAR
jgi:hypothetical protein